MGKRFGIRIGGKRSKLEVEVELAIRKLPHLYEPKEMKMSYKTEHKYIPDYYLTEKNVFIEVKGYFPVSDRSKMLAVRRDNEDKRIILWFSDPHKVINKGSKTTYGDWCEKHGFEYVSSIKELMDILR